MTDLIEITQADRDAAASGYYAWLSGNPVIPRKMQHGLIDDHSMIQAFATHRALGRRQGIEEVVAWLRDADGHGEDFERADQIEAEFLK